MTLIPSTNINFGNYPNNSKMDTLMEIALNLNGTKAPSKIVEVSSSFFRGELTEIISSGDVIANENDSNFLFNNAVSENQKGAEIIGAHLLITSGTNPNINIDLNLFKSDVFNPGDGAPYAPTLANYADYIGTINFLKASAYVDATPTFIGMYVDLSANPIPFVTASGSKGFYGQPVAAEEWNAPVGSEVFTVRLLIRRT